MCLGFFCVSMCALGSFQHTDNLMVTLTQHNAMFVLAGSLQATRALMVAGILLGLIAIFVAVTGMKCMKCMEDDEVKKMRMAVFGGVIFLIAGW